jgi:3-hydroxybutyryl-CoA dehydrogenase
MNLCVLGSGTMGRGIVSFFAQMQFVTHIYWWGRKNGEITTQMDVLRRDLIKQCRRANLTENETTIIIEKVDITHDIEDLSDADFYIEAVAENMEIKKRVLLHLNKVLPINAIVASNTSSLSITELSMCLSRPEQFIGMHFFNPISVMKLVEIVVGLTTSNETLEKTKNIVIDLEKYFVIVNDSPGFIVNRMLIPMINEAIAIYSEGIALKEDIDAAMKLGANHPIGPIALADLIGTDVCLSIIETLHQETGDPKYRAHPLLRQYVRAGRLGRKTRRGFYEY